MKRLVMSSGIFCAGILGAIVFLGLGSQAFAQLKPEPPRSVDAPPNSTLASFGDWALRCQRLGNGAEAQRVCEVAQQIRGQDQQNPVAELAIGRLKKADSLRLTVVLPVNVTFSGMAKNSGRRLKRGRFSLRRLNRARPLKR
jgi:invasion protein IalB